jgi:hypothetical protein
VARARQASGYANKMAGDAASSTDSGGASARAAGGASTDNAGGGTSAGGQRDDQRGLLSGVLGEVHIVV